MLALHVGLLKFNSTGIGPEASAPLGKKLTVPKSWTCGRRIAGILSLCSKFIVGQKPSSSISQPHPKTDPSAFLPINPFLGNRRGAGWKDFKKPGTSGAGWMYNHSVRKPKRKFRLTALLRDEIER